MSALGCSSDGLPLSRSPLRYVQATKLLSRISIQPGPFKVGHSTKNIIHYRIGPFTVIDGSDEEPILTHFCSDMLEINRIILSYFILVILDLVQTS